MCRLNFYLLAYLCLSAEMWTNSEYIMGAGVTPPPGSTPPQLVLAPSGSRTQDSGAGGGRSNKERQRLQPLMSVARAPPLRSGERGLHTALTGIHPLHWNKKNSPTQTSTSQIRFHLAHKERWLTRRVRWHRQDDGWRVSKRNVKVPVLNLLTSESDINLSQECQSILQMRNSPRSTKWKVNKW